MQKNCGKTRNRTQKSGVLREEHEMGGNTSSQDPHVTGHHSGARRREERKTKSTSQNADKGSEGVRKHLSGYVVDLTQNRTA